MTTATLQDLIATLLESAQTIAAEPDDPMHESLREARDIESVDCSGDNGLTVTTIDGQQLRILIAGDD